MVVTMGDKEPLVLQPTEEWPRLRDFFKDYCPFGIAGYNLLDTQIHFRNLCLDCDFQVYYPYGNIANGMVAKLQKNERHEVIIMTTSDNTSKLEQAILNSSVIDWSEGRTEVSDVMPGSTRDMLDRVYPQIGLKLVKESFSYMHVFDINSEPYANVTYPEGTYVAAVRPEHVSQVDRAWPHRYTSSDLFFTLLIQAGQSYGLFFSADDSLVAWLFINEAGYLCHLYCGEQHRRKGYAEFMVKHVTNDQISKRKRVFCHICEGNVKSMQLFSKLGFSKIESPYSCVAFEKE